MHILAILRVRERCEHGHTFKQFGGIEIRIQFQQAQRRCSEPEGQQIQTFIRPDMRPCAARILLAGNALTHENPPLTQIMHRGAFYACDGQAEYLAASARFSRFQ